MVDVPSDTETVTSEGNLLTFDDQVAKLDLIVETAREAWGWSLYSGSKARGNRAGPQMATVGGFHSTSPSMRM